MTALVTGAGGFLGRHLRAQLATLGIPVVTLGRTVPADVEPRAGFTLADPSDGAAIRAVMEQVRPRLVFHLAGTPAPEPLTEAYRVNTLFGAHLLDAARRLEAPPRVLLAGSAAEYGPVAEEALPVAEDAPCRPVSAYGITKLAQTLHGLAAADAGLPVVIARLFNIVGAGMPAHLALGAFAQQIAAMPAEGGALRSGPLERERDFVEARPSAAVLVALLQDHRAAGRVVNVCSGQPTSLATLTRALVAASGKPVTLREEAMRIGNSDMIRHWGSSTLLQSLGHELAPADPAVVAADLLSS